MYDLLVIGGGPAALAATCYALTKRLSVVMIYEELGGKLGWLPSLLGAGAAPELPGADLVHALTLRTMAHPGCTFNDRVSAVARTGASFTVKTDQRGDLHSRTVLIATGATPIMLKVPGAETLAEEGLGYSATTAAPLERGQRVAVIGGTSRALSGAAELAATDAQVWLITPDTSVLTTPLGRALRNQPEVKIFGGWEVTRLSRQNGTTEVAIARPDEVHVLEVDRVFVALGVVPNSRLVRGLAATDADGFIMVSAFQETSVPGLVAAGDVTSRFGENVMIAIGDGARAAQTAYDYLLAERLVPQV